MAKMKRLYDDTRVDYQFQVGDYVLLWDHRKRSKLHLSKSLLLRWRGPFRVIQKLSSTNYKLQYVLDSSVVQNSHVIHMRPYDASNFHGRRQDEVIPTAQTTSTELYKEIPIENSSTVTSAKRKQPMVEQRLDSSERKQLRRSVRLLERAVKETGSR
jgi:hypothetical protein